MGGQVDHRDVPRRVEPSFRPAVRSGDHDAVRLAGLGPHAHLCEHLDRQVGRDPHRGPLLTDHLQAQVAQPDPLGLRELHDALVGQRAAVRVEDLDDRRLTRLEPGARPGESASTSRASSSCSRTNPRAISSPAAVRSRQGSASNAIGPSRRLVLRGAHGRAGSVVAGGFDVPGGVPGHHEQQVGEPVEVAHRRPRPPRARRLAPPRRAARRGARRCARGPAARRAGRCPGTTNTGRRGRRSTSASMRRSSARHHLRR